MSKPDTAIPAAKPATPAHEEITLDTPVVRGDQRIEKVTVRKPMSGELRGIALADLMKLDVGALHVLLPRITIPTLTSQDVAQLEIADLVQLGGVVVGFLLTKAERASLSPAG